MRNRICGALVVVLLGGLTSSPITVYAADVAVSAPSARAVVVDESVCLRWVWQEYSWYDDCWWRRNPYVGRQATGYRQDGVRLRGYR